MYRIHQSLLLLLLLMSSLLSPSASWAQEVQFPLTLKFGKSNPAPQFISLAVPDGNYVVTVTVGSRRQAASTTIRCEARRLYVENLTTGRGEQKSRTFVVNKRNRSYLDDKGEQQLVKTNNREEGSPTWDDSLTFEVTGDKPLLTELRIDRDTLVPTLFLCGNSTVVDQRFEPWASWGQMFPRFVNDHLAVANYAESGLSLTTLLSQNRWAKVKSLLREGDYVLLEFGHNDQKQDGRPGFGAYYAFSQQVKQVLDDCRACGATLILCTPTMRRSFEGTKVVNTHKDYPAAIRDIAQREGLTLIDLQEMTGRFYEAMGPENSTQAFVHYPAGTWPGQDKALADNTHFNPYGAYEIAKMVARALRESGLPLAACIDSEVAAYDPAHPDPIADFHWTPCTMTDTTKPAGN